MTETNLHFFFFFFWGRKKGEKVRKYDESEVFSTWKHLPRGDP